MPRAVPPRWPSRWRDAAKTRGDHAAAFELYQMGGHFAAADSELLSWAATQPDDVALYARVREHFSYRTQPAFAANEKLRLQITGAYKPDPRHLALVRAMPVHGVERALADEATAFDEQYLTAYQALMPFAPQKPHRLRGRSSSSPRARRPSRRSIRTMR